MMWSELPSGWRLETLPDVADVTMGQSPPGETYNRTGDGVPFFQGKAEFGLDHPVVRQWCTRPTRLAEPGDLLMSVRAPIGPTNVADVRCAVGRGLAIIRPRNGVPVDLIRYALKLQEPEIASWGTGSTFTAINKAHFKLMVVPVPPPELRAPLVDLIRNIVRLERRSLNQTVAARRQLELFRQTVLAAACTGRLTADWRAEHPDAVPVEAALERLKVSRPPRRPNKEQAVELPMPDDLPGTYGQAPLADVASRIEYGTSKQASSDASIGIPMLRMGNIQDGSLDLSDLKFCAVDDEVRRLLLVQGDLLFNRTNSPELVGKAAVFRGPGDTTFASYLIRVQLDPKLALPDFVNLWINSAWGKAWASLAKSDGVSQSNINGSKLGLMTVPLPPVAEQAVIVERAETMLARAGHLLAAIDQAEAAIRATARSAIAQGTSGVLDGRASDLAVGLGVR
jgi:type I restriction enzyme, S subunit